MSSGGPSRSNSNRWKTVLLAFCVAIVLAGCAESFGPVGDDDDDKFDEVELQQDQTESGANASAALTPEPVATLTPVPTSTPAPTLTPTPVPTATPVPTPTSTPTPLPTSTPTPTPTPMFPPELVGEQLRATIGESVTEVIATDSDGRVSSMELLNDVEGVSIMGNASLRFAPVAAGTFTQEVLVTDSQGLTARGEVRLAARWAGHPQALVALGDSVASGHGLDLADYFVTDPCWRAPNSYPRRVFNQLVQKGVFPEGRGEFALLACSGYDVDDLWEREVTGGFPDARPDDGKRTQLDWAVRANPRFAVVTIGANDTGFVGPAQLFLDDGVTLDRDQVARRLTVIRQDLATVIDTLLESTDATVFVSNYYNPTAENPQGIPTCRLTCFRAAADEVVNGMNDAIEETVRSYSDNAGDRVVFVDFSERFIGKGAPNGLGPDNLREDGFSALGNDLAGQVKDVHPYCARGETVGASWISPVDCVHPDERGTAELADLMTAAILDFVA